MSVSYRQLPRSSNQVYRIPYPIQNGDKLYLDSKTSDVHFTFQSEDEAQATTSIVAHRVLLANISNVFKGLFFGEPKPGDNEILEIPMTDVTNEAAFKEFLQFFYLCEVELHAENIADLMLLGQKYKVSTCTDVCVQFLMDIATADNILVAIGLAVKYSHADLLKFCEKFIVMNTAAVLESDGFLECDHQTLTYIVNANILTCSEVKIFEACMAWVKAKTKQSVLTKELVDEHLGDLFYDIRFGSMTIQDLCNLATKYDMVLSNDFKTITKLIVLPNFQSERFNTRQRQIKWSEDICMMGCNAIESNLTDEFHDAQDDDDDGFDGDNFKRKNKTIFSTNKRLRLVSSTCNEMQRDSFSSDEEMEYPTSSENSMPLEMTFRQEKKPLDKN